MKEKTISVNLIDMDEKKEINKIGLDPFSCSFLEKRGIKTVDDLCDMTQKEIEKLCEERPSLFEEILFAIDCRGYSIHNRTVSYERVELLDTRLDGLGISDTAKEFLLTCNCITIRDFLCFESVDFFTPNEGYYAALDEIINKLNCMGVPKGLLSSLYHRIRLKISENELMEALYCDAIDIDVPLNTPEFDMNDDIKKAPISILELSVMTTSFLEKEGINTVGQLCEINKNWIKVRMRKRYGFVTRSQPVDMVEHINESLKKYNLSINEEPVIGY